MLGHTSSQSDDAGLLPVSLTMAIGTVLVALISLFGHRAHTHTIIAQNRMGDAWVNYQSDRIGLINYQGLLDFLSLAQLRDPAQAQRIKADYLQRMDCATRGQKELEARIKVLESEAERREKAADRFDLGGACLEAALVIISLTLLTKQRMYWRIGMVLGCAGLMLAATGLFPS
jgi:hypothetical protein